MWPFVSGLFHLAQCFQVSSMLWHELVLCSILSLNNIPLYGCTICCYPSLVDEHLSCCHFLGVCVCTKVFYLQVPPDFLVAKIPSLILSLQLHFFLPGLPCGLSYLLAYGVSPQRTIMSISDLAHQICYLVVLLIYSFTHTYKCLLI